ncbi:MAG: hypothetical protein KJ561_04535, partial [Nanoarchaeota archaeon]|nr:hypothetical protein [Nanoarchaeota archaeon]
MILQSIKKTLKIIKNNKTKLFLIFFLQVILFASLSIISYKTIIPAMDHARNAVDYYDSINITENSGTFGYLGEDPLSVYNSYNKMMYYLKYLALFAILSILLISSIIWPLSSS